MTSAFADPRTLPLEMDMSPSIELSSSASGRVTALACSKGRVLGSGDIAMRIDGQPVAALASEQPFYRDITWGAEGADVDGLRVALRDLEYSVSASGRYGGDLHDAVAAFQRDRGIEPADGSLLLSSILWIPNAQTVPSECSLSLGQTYAGGDLFATVRGDLRSLRVVQDVDNVMVPGPRRVTVLGVQASLSEDGVVDDPEQVSDIQSAPTFAATLAAIESTPLTAQSALATPVQVVSLPPAALFDVSGSAACVEGPVGAVPVEIVGTGMGATLVRFPGGSTPSEVVLGSSLAGTGCAA
ncbi:peptidoglycan-binding domain-containing protein [Microbacterium sp. T32]|uniref:peptidoglycan-binding domain-containing protein n=1 Tax=Microbacterium sp. T32 TaxID=1776083 RepID=UPI0009EF4251|nr:peptidoglycan-binding domain-containing protein [Microbacterium sp. T32]